MCSIAEATVWKLDRLTFRYTLANNAETQKEHTIGILSRVPVRIRVLIERQHALLCFVQHLAFNSYCKG